MGRISRSFALMRASQQVMRINPSLMYYPLVATISTLVLVGIFAAPIALNVAGLRDTFFSTTAASSHTPLGWYPLIILFGLLSTWIAVFTNSAFYLAANAALDGRRLAWREAFAEAWSRRVIITQWALFTATVGLVLRLIAERAGMLGSLVTRWLGLAWALATVFVVPVLVTHQVSPVDAVQQSAALFKKTWGEKVVADISLGLISVLALVVVTIPGAAIIIMAISSGLPVAVPIIDAAVYLLVCFAIIMYFNCLQTIFTSALYRYADTGDYVGPYTAELIQGAFRRK